ncbi:hypothetical protein K503DRAFT_806184 [Rhizopogon vinicolor AM-OR11-026]|uniref:Uncharacterized protein n=1 Tax=Rhizopogon vinicolor AM-OR11-026 TaxID=1314800 RepID=A0A1B7MFB9_9AGAM|nr:hypothetical protein K503DRAFT_806184 [Rhizopogon vinicolor AM-OR11-026]
MGRSSNKSNESPYPSLDPYKPAFAPAYLPPKKSVDVIAEAWTHIPRVSSLGGHLVTLARRGIIIWQTNTSYFMQPFGLPQLSAYVQR